MPDKNFLKNTFASVISDYEAARPTYPAALYEDICAFSGLTSGMVVLEVGAGTGQATELFINGGYRLDLLEVSSAQVDFLCAKYDGRARVFRDYFETFTPDRSYDLIYSATAFHWIDAAVGYPKAWRMLNPGGTLAVFWHMSSVTMYTGGVFDALNDVERRHRPGASLGFDNAGIESAKSKRIAQVQSGGFFGVPEIREYRWTDIYDAERYVKLVNTYSETQALPGEVRERYLNDIRDCVNDFGGKVEMPQLVCLYLVKKG